MQTLPHGFRLAIVLSHPTQYYSPWFRWVATHTAITLRVFYLWDFGVTLQRDPKFAVPIKWDVDLLSGYESESVPNTARDPGTHHFTGLRNPDATRRIAAWHPDGILLFGYKWLTHVQLIIWARRRRIPLIFRGDSHYLGRGSPRGIKRAILKTVYAQFSAVLPVGVANDEYFSLLGVPSARRFLAPHSVNDALFDRSDPKHAAAANHLRDTLNLPRGVRVLLFAGKLVPEKQPGELLEAFLGVAVRDSALVFVGDGPVKQTLIARAASASAPAVHFLPFANQSEMPSRYAMADIFALPSRGNYETWGLAVNEAMHMGTPCLVSDRVGCQRDLVTPDETGWVFPADNRDALRARLADALRDVADPTTRNRLRHAVTTRISGYTYRQTTAGLEAALAFVRSNDGVPCAPVEQRTTE